LLRDSNAWYKPTKKQHAFGYHRICARKEIMRCDFVPLLRSIVKSDRWGVVRGEVRERCRGEEKENIP
jgi:hypothetical protein